MPADLAELQALLAGARAPAGLDREGRVQLIGQAAEALLAGRLPDGPARVFLAAAVLAWLERGGDLQRDYFRVTKPKSHRTPAAIWRGLRSHRDERQAGEPHGRIPPSSTAEKGSIP